MTIERLTDEDLELLPWGNSVHYGPRMAGDLAEASQLVNEALMAMGSGKPLTQRQYALVAWLLTPVGEGERISNELPHKKGRIGRKSGVSFQSTVTAVSVQSYRNAGKSKDDAIATVAGKASLEDSVRGDYERVQNKMGVDGLKRYTYAMSETAEKIMAQFPKVSPRK